MRVIDAPNGAWAAYLAPRICLEEGTARRPRGMPTQDLGPAAVVLHDPRDPIPAGVRDNLSLAIGVAEGLQLVGGFSNPAVMTALSPFFGELLDQGGRADGAYGPRAKRGIEHAIEQLGIDPSTRQAVALVWDTFDPLSGSKDVPCTVALTFYVSGEHLCLHAQMRSWDATLGLPYDLMQFSMLLCSAANTLGREIGTLTVTATSLHAYERDVTTIESLHEPSGYTAGRPLVVGRQGMSWPEIRKSARHIFIGMGQMENETASERWMKDTLNTRLVAVGAR